MVVVLSSLIVPSPSGGRSKPLPAISKLQGLDHETSSADHRFYVATSGSGQNRRPNFGAWIRKPWKTTENIVETDGLGGKCCRPRTHDGHAPADEENRRKSSPKAGIILPKGTTSQLGQQDRWSRIAGFTPELKIPFAKESVDHF
jgi:hypothetical protein